MRLQNTIKKEIHLEGKGLHTGRDITLKLKPAPRDTGVIFIRTDKGDAEVKASVSSVSDTTFATTLSSNGARVGTVEHLLAALSGLNVDNVYVELNGPEVPVMDGSAITFVSLILEAGVAQQAKTISCSARVTA